MSRIYSNTNRIRFTDIPEKYAIPRGYRAKQCEVHSAVVTYVFEHYKDTKKFRQRIVDALNHLTYCVMQDCPPPFQWKSTDPLDTMPDDISSEDIEKTLGAFFLTPEAIDWDVAPRYDKGLGDNEAVESSNVHSDALSSVTASNLESVSTSVSIPKQPLQVINRPLQEVKIQHKRETRKVTMLTPKEDLYIQPPKCPRFDINKIWMSTTINGDNLVIYTTLPEIPTCQNEISVTTNPAIMTEEEFMALYPKQVIHTRHANMYERYSGIDYDEDLGCIFPISGFTKEEIVDNIIRYPHLYRLRKIGPDGTVTKFFSSIEIDGKIFPIDQIWDTLPDSKLIPRDSEFVKEYVVRRYLLEEQKGIKHKYNIFGSLDPFLTLFMPVTKYIERGYTDVLQIVKQCVTSRIHYKQSRNPILRRIEESHAQLHF